LNEAVAWMTVQGASAVTWTRHGSGFYHTVQYCTVQAVPVQVQYDIMILILYAPTP
jgi:hypothetical protein